VLRKSDISGLLALSRLDNAVLAEATVHCGAFNLASLHTKAFYDVYVFRRERGQVQCFAPASAVQVLIVRRLGLQWKNKGLDAWVKPSEVRAHVLNVQASVDLTVLLSSRPSMQAASRRNLPKLCMSEDSTSRSFCQRITQIRA
jgi:hypothetical protein